MTASAHNNAQPMSVLVVEDDKNILNLLSAYLENAGYSVDTATDGNLGLQKALENTYDICVLDIMLPGKTGTDIASAMRAAGRGIPILFLTALGNESDILRGFGVGADDYIVKPFSPRILLVRISAIIKRIYAGQAIKNQLIKQGPITLDNNQPSCLVNDIPVELTPYEYRILRQLIRSPDRVFERGALISAIYGNEYSVSPKAIDVHVHHLRIKLGKEAGDLIQTVRGFGYKLSTQNYARNIP